MCLKLFQFGRFAKRAEPSGEGCLGAAFVGSFEFLRLAGY